MNNTTSAIDEHGRTVVQSTGTSRRGIISQNGSSFHFVPTVNHGETAVRGGRMFKTMRGALKAADKFVAAGVNS